MSDSTPERNSHRSVLVVQTAFLGDLVLGIPFYRRLRKIWPEHNLVLLCRKGLGDFFLKTKLFDQVVEIVKKDQSSYDKALLSLKDNSIEFIFSPHESLRTAFLCYKLKAEHKVSFQKFWNAWFFNHRLKKPKSWPDPLRQMSLLFPWDEELKNKAESYEKENNFYKKEPGGKLSSIPEWSLLDLRNELNADIFTFQRLSERFHLKNYIGKKWIFLFPGSVWATKMWTENGFAETGRVLQSRNHQVFIMGGPGEEELAQNIQRRIPGSINLVGKTSVYESCLLLTKASLMIGNDSAATHLACAAGVPTVTLFGPTVLEFGFRPWSNQSYVVEKEGLLCRPCGPHGHRRCPLGTHECMKNISAESVLKVCESLIQ